MIKNFFFIFYQYSLLNNSGPESKEKTPYVGKWRCFFLAEITPIQLIRDALRPPTKDPYTLTFMHFESQPNIAIYYTINYFSL